MKRKLCCFVVLSTMLATCFLFATLAKAQQSHSLEIAAVAICHNVVDREPVDAGTRFESTVGKLYCFTHVKGAQNETEIYHVWYFVDSERAVVRLQIKSDSWRTNSSKIIQPNEIGDWRVEVLGPEGDVLKIVHFEIAQ